MDESFLKSSFIQVKIQSQNTLTINVFTFLNLECYVNQPDSLLQRDDWLHEQRENSREIAALHSLENFWRTEGSGGRDLISMYKYMMGGQREKRDRLFAITPNDRTRIKGHQLKHGTFSMNKRNLFTVWQWHNLSRGTVESPLLEMFRNRLDMVLSILF